MSNARACALTVASIAATGNPRWHAWQSWGTRNDFPLRGDWVPLGSGCARLFFSSPTAEVEPCRHHRRRWFESSRDALLRGQRRRCVLTSSQRRRTMSRATNEWRCSTQPTRWRGHLCVKPDIVRNGHVANTPTTLAVFGTRPDLEGVGPPHHGLVPAQLTN